MSRRLELTGRKFERLLVKSREENTPNGQTRWKCVCDCGKESIVNGNYCKENCKWEIIGNQNFNISLKSNNTTGRSGLSTRIQKDGVVKWVATIGYKGKSIYLGIFNTHEEAVVARDLAEMTYYGKIKQ